MVIILLDGVFFFLPEDVVKNAPNDRLKLLQPLIQCLLIPGNDLSYLILQ
jgi:hypothetical protein